VSDKERCLRGISLQRIILWKPSGAVAYAGILKRARRTSGVVRRATIEGYDRDKIAEIKKEKLTGYTRIPPGLSGFLSVTLRYFSLLHLSFFTSVANFISE